MIKRRTIARDLAVALVVTMFVVFGCAAIVNYMYSIERDRSILLDDANEIADNLASVLITPMWNINNEEIINLVEVYRKSGTVSDIFLVDDETQPIIKRRNSSPAYLELERDIIHEGTNIGRVTVYFSDSAILQRQYEVLVYSLVVFSLLTLAIVLALATFLRRYLAVPFSDLREGLEVISGGDYSHNIDLGRQEDMNDITNAVNFMATEIDKRESALEENKGKLETLNQAILDIFSCSDTNSLIKTSMQLVHRVCGVDHGWFLGEIEDTESSDENDSLPVPLVCVNGHTFEASEHDVAPHVGKNDRKKTFSYEIKSRYRTVGTVTLEFREEADGSTISLMQSLMSLTNLAMTRQSFIRETAFIQAELQVAETFNNQCYPIPTANLSERMLATITNQFCASAAIGLA